MKRFLLLALLLSACSTTRKDTEVLRQGVYAVRDSLDAGRFDLADDYSNETTKLVAPPQHRIQIRPLR